MAPPQPHLVCVELNPDGSLASVLSCPVSFLSLTVCCVVWCLFLRILATTRYYLLLLSTVISGDAKDGWNKSMTSSAKPPIKLQLSPVDLQKYNVTNLAFTAAHFNTGDNITEEWIITSVGPYIITWNFKRIKTDPDKWPVEQ